MLKTRLHSIPRFALPYTTDDFMAAVSALRNGTPPPDGFALLGNSPKFWTSSGRQALRLLLTSLDLPPGSGVAVPLFTDPSLASAIVGAGHRPVFIDVDPETLTMDPRALAAASGQYSALVIVHLFGQVADVPSLLAIAGNVPVVEDTAHAPLSFLLGRMVGEFGIGCFYSFASTKYWPAGGGGLAVVHDPEVGSRMARAVQGLTPPPRLRELRNLVMQAAKSVVFSRRAYGFLGRPMRRWADGLALLEPCLDMLEIQSGQAAAARRQALRFPLRVEQQRANSLRLLSHLSRADEVVLPRERPEVRYNYHIFPVLLRDREERDAVRASMWRHFVDTSTLYSDSIERCARFGYRGGCPVSESVATRVITLPNYAALSHREIDTVAEVFLSSLQAVRSVRRVYPAISFGQQQVPVRK
jgi:dTDP-4-amino-4,6-dideoxygalactose transaminase